MKKILITGATGFVGRNLVRQFSENREYELICLVRDLEKAQKFLPTNAIITNDIPSISTIDVEYVVHLASYLSSRDDIQTVRSILNANVLYGTEVLNALRECRNLKFINFGSFAEYRNGPEKPDCAYIYTAAKRAFRPILDYYAKLGNWDYIHLIPYTIYGGENTQKKLIDYVKESINANKPVDMSPGYQVSDFIHIDDVIDCVKYLIDHPERWEGKKGEDYYLGTGRGFSIRELAAIIENKEGKKCNINWGGLPYRAHDVMHAVAPIGKLLDLGWQAKIRLEDSI